MKNWDRLDPCKNERVDLSLVRCQCRSCKDEHFVLKKTVFVTCGAWLSLRVIVLFSLSFAGTSAFVGRQGTRLVGVV